jgi:hypothetical protein
LEFPVLETSQPTTIPPQDSRPSLLIGMGTLQPSHATAMEGMTGHGRFALQFCRLRPYTAVAMRILIQDPESKQYYDGVHWETDLDLAREFDTVFAAEEYCRENEIRSALIVVMFNNSKSQDIKYAVGPAHVLLTSKPPTTRLYHSEHK